MASRDLASARWHEARRDDLARAARHVEISGYRAGREGCIALAQSRHRYLECAACGKACPAAAGKARRYPAGSPLVSFRTPRDRSAQLWKKVLEVICAHPGGHEIDSCQCRIVGQSKQFAQARNKILRQPLDILIRELVRAIVKHTVQNAVGNVCFYAQIVLALCKRVYAAT